MAGVTKIKVANITVGKSRGAAMLKELYAAMDKVDTKEPEVKQ